MNRILYVRIYQKRSGRLFHVQKSGKNGFKERLIYSQEPQDKISLQLRKICSLNHIDSHKSHYRQYTKQPMRNSSCIASSIGKYRVIPFWPFQNIFLIDLDRKNIKLISSGTSPTRIVKILKMTLVPPGGHIELVLICHLAK